MKINEIIVLEGKSDTHKVKLAVDADTIETNGSALSKTTLRMIRHAQEKRGVIIFTDPDYAGKRIRHLIIENIPECKQAFLPKSKAQPKQMHQSVGIEHASIEDIQQALLRVSAVEASENLSDITKQDLIQRKLIGGPHAKQLRNRIGEQLRIGYTNGKQLLTRLHMYRITLAKLDACLVEMERKQV